MLFVLAIINFFFTFLFQELMNEIIRITLTEYNALGEYFNSSFTSPLHDLEAANVVG